MKDTIMKELNRFEGVEVIEEDGHDTLTITDMGDTVSFSQVSEDGNLHNVIMSISMVKAALALFVEAE